MVAGVAVPGGAGAAVAGAGGTGGGGNGRGRWTWGGGGALGGVWGSGSGGGGGWGWWMGMGGGGRGEPGGASGGRGRWSWGGGGVPGGVGGRWSGGGGGFGWGSCMAGGGRGRWTWGGGGARGGARGSGSDGSGVSGGRGGPWGSRSGASGSVGAVGECAVRGGERERRCLRDRAPSLESSQSGGVGGSWGASRGAAWYWGGGGVPRRPWIRHVGVWWRQRLVVWVEGLSLAGLGPGGPFGVVVVAGGIAIRFLVRGGWLVRGGRPLAVGGVCGWSAGLPSHSVVLFVHGGLWPGGVGRWAMVVVGVVLVVVVVGPLVVVVCVVVGLVLRVWPMDPLLVFRSPLWGWGVGHRGQSPGLHYVVGRGGGLGAGFDGDGGRGVPRPLVGLAGGGGGLWGMDDGALGDGDADEGLDGVVLGGRLCGGGGCRWEGGVGCGGWGVLAWVRVPVRAVLLGFVSLRLWCCVCSRGRRLEFGVGFGVGVRFQVEDYVCLEV